MGPSAEGRNFIAHGDDDDKMNDINRLSIFLFLLAALVSCRTTHIEGDKAENQTAGGPEKSEKDDLTKIPPTLWSPALRKASAGYYFMVAETITLKERDPKKALPLYEAAYGLDPNPFLGGKMLVAKALAGQKAEALLEAKRMALLYPTDANLRFFYGDLLASSGQLSEAAEQLEKSIEFSQDQEGAYLLLVQVYQGMQDTPKAIVVANELVKKQPSSIAGWSQLSRLYLITRRYKEALTPARRAWEMQSANPQLTQIYAIALQLNGKTAQAIRIYEQLYRMDPSDEELTSRMVDLYRELGNLESALELLEEMSRKDSTQKRPIIQMQRAILLWELKRNDEAAQLLNEVLQQYPDSDRVHYLAAFAAERRSDFKRAVELYRSVPAESSLKNEAEIRILLIYRQHKSWSGAFAQANKLLTKKNLPWEAYGIIASVYGDGERFKDAVKAASDGYEKYPAQPRLLYLKGVYQERAGDMEACIVTMQEVIKKDPTNSGAFNFLGYMYAERGENLVEAEQLIRKALELKPNDGFYLDSLGWLYYQKGQYDKALQYLEKALKIEPNEGAIKDHLADVKVKMGQKKAALELYRSALKNNLEPKDRKRVLEKLKKLEGLPE